jgi:ribosomal protein S6--L-glutamate ligase
MKPPRIGIIGVRDGWSSQRLAASVAARTGAGPIIELADVALDLDRGAVRTREVDLLAFDALIVKKLGGNYAPELLDRLEVLHFVHRRGVPVFSRPQALMQLLDRLSCTVALRLADIPMPPTTITENLDAAEEAVRRYHRVVLKPLFTSKARGMQVLEAGGDIRPRLKDFQASGNPVLYIQKMVSIPGQDLGLAFLGGQYLACYSRVRDENSSAWATSTSAGGKYQPYTPSAEIIELARRAQTPFGLDFTCVDVVETDDGPLVFEVSAFGGFRGLLEANGIDAAGAYLDHVLREIGRGA